MRRGDALATTSRGRVGELVLALHEPVAVEVDEERALAADRLTDHGAGRGTLVRGTSPSGGTARTRGRAARHPHAGHAIPSPVEPVGLVVCEKTFPSRPRRVRTARQRTAPTPSAALAHHGRVTPAIPPSSASSASTARGARPPRCPAPRGRQPPALAGSPRHGVAAGMRDPVTVVSPSRVTTGRPPGVAKLAPSAISSRTASGPSCTGPHRLASQPPAPATRVSRRAGPGCPRPERCGDPPCAHCVDRGEDVLGDDEDLLDRVPQPQRGGQPGCRSRQPRRPAGGPSRPAASGGGQQA